MVAACDVALETGSTEQALEAGTLPGGTAISVAIDEPLDSAVFPPGPVPVAGTAEIGLGAILADTAIIYVIDVSGSTDATGGCGGDPNRDGRANTILDCELAAVSALNDQAVALGTVADVGIVVFGERSATADMSAQAGDQRLTGPAASVDPDGRRDVDAILASVDTGSVARFTGRSVGTLTNFGDSITSALGALSLSTKSRKIVAFLSDGFATSGSTVTSALTGVSPDIHFFSFAVGTGATCVDGSPFGNLQQIATMTGGTCTNVPNVASLPSILPGIIGSQLVGLTLTVDGAPVALDSIAPALPVSGPASVAFSATPVITVPGPHTICAQAAGVDAGGAGSVTDCVDILINRPPVAVCENATVVADAACQASASIDGGSFDPDGDAISCGQTPPGAYGLGVTEVVLSCADDYGARALCGSTVTVVDQTQPVVSCPGPQVLECVGGGAVASFTATAVDNCSIPSVTCAPPSGTVFPPGTSTSTCSAVDGAGNTATCTVPITVVDTVAPVVAVRSTRISLWPPNHNYHTISLADCVTSVTDACGGTLDIATAGTITRIRSDEAEKVNGSGNTCRDALITSATTASLRAERAGPQDGRVYTIDFVVRDGAGNSTAASCQVEVPHDQSGDPAGNGACGYCVGADCGSCPGPSPTCR